MPRAWFLTTALAITAFMSLRVASAQKELWLDEIWGIRIVEKLTSPAQIWTKLRMDNHSLCSLYYYIIGPMAPEWLYRLPSLLAGLLSMGLAIWIVREQQTRDQGVQHPRCIAFGDVTTIILVGCSYLLVHFDSEARGYAPCIFFCLLAFMLLLKGEHHKHSPLAVGYWFAIALGLLAQPVAVHMLISGGLWSCLRWHRTRNHWKKVAAEAVWWHLIPSLFFIIFYLKYVRLLQTGGATDIALLTGASNAWAYTLGLPLSWGVTSLVVGLLITVVGLTTLYKQHNDLWIFYGTSILASPLALSLMRRSSYNYERYFIVNAVMAILLMAYILTHLHKNGKRGQIACLLILTFFTIGNTHYTTQLIRYGRGSYLTMLKDMTASSSQKTITVSSDHDFRHTMPLNFHFQRMENPPSQLIYYPQPQRPVGGTQWLLTQNWQGDPSAPDFIRDQYGNVYRIFKTYPSSYLAGFRLQLYQRHPAEIQQIH